MNEISGLCYRHLNPKYESFWRILNKICVQSLYLHILQMLCYAHVQINVHEQRQIVWGLKNKKAVGNDGIPSEVYKFPSVRLLTFMSIFLSACMLTGKLPKYPYARSDHTATEVQI